MSYDPATMSAADAEAIVARARRYCLRHGSPYGETPLPGGDIEEAVQVIIMDTLSADWDALEWSYVQRNGRTLFPATLSAMGMALRAMLFMAGRARRRGWVESGPMRRAARAEHRRRDLDDTRGAGMASRAADPSLILSAVESAAGGLRSVPDRARRRRRRMLKTRNSSRGLVTVTSRPAAMLDADGRAWFPVGSYTGVQIERVTVFNFRQAGDTPNRQTPKTLNRLPEGWTPDALREALEG